MFSTNRLIFASSLSLLAVSALAFAADAAPPDSVAQNAAPAQSAAPDSMTQSATPSSADAAFIAKALPAGHDEIRAAHAAIKGSTDAGVTKAAKMIIRDHRMANKKLVALSRQKGWALPPHGPSAPAAGGYSDQQYIAGQIQAHQDAIALFQNEAAQGSDSDLRAFAQQTLPKLQHHLKTLQSLQKT